jgi:hypothetical protein
VWDRRSSKASEKVFVPLLGDVPTHDKPLTNMPPAADQPGDQPADKDSSA